MTLPFSRRSFLRGIGLAAGAAMSTSIIQRVRAAETLNEPAEKKRSVIIVGAGLAGLVAAYELEKKNIAVTILEADKDHIGGRVRTWHPKEGGHAEFGAMRIPTKHLITRQYCKELDIALRPFVLSNPEAYYYVRGKKFRNKDVKSINALFNLAAGEKDKSSDDLWADVVTAAVKNFTDEERKDLLSAQPKSEKIRSLDSLSLQALFEKSGMSQEAIELMAVTQGQEAEMRYACTESLREEMLEVWSQGFDEVVEGTDHITRTFVKKLKTQINQGAEVTAITQDAAGVKVTFNKAGNSQTIAADFALVTVTAPVLQRFDIELSPAKRRAIRQISYDSSTKVLAMCSQRFWETNDKIFGGGTFTDLPSGSTYYPSDNAIKKDPAVSAAPAIMLASYTWGAAARRLAALPSAKRADLVVQHLSKVHPELLDPKILTRAASWSWDTYPWTAGAFCWFEPGQQTNLYKDLISPEGRIHFAGEHTSLAHTWMQGALESGLRATDAILRA